MRQRECSFYGWIHDQENGESEKMVKKKKKKSSKESRKQCIVVDVPIIMLRVCPRVFDQVGHDTIYASSGNKHFFTK